MYIFKNHGFKRRYVIGGSGILEPFGIFISRLASSAATKAKGDVAKEAAKRAAIDTGKKLIERGVTKILTPAAAKAITPKSHAILTYAMHRNVNPSAQNINPLIDGSGMPQNAVSIQDLVRKVNGKN